MERLWDGTCHMLFFISAFFIRGKLSLDFAKTCPWLLETPAMSHCPFILLGHMPHHLCKTALCGKNTRQSGPAIDTNTRKENIHIYATPMLWVHKTANYASENRRWKLFGKWDMGLRISWKSIEKQKCSQTRLSLNKSWKHIRCKLLDKQDISLSIGWKSTRCKLFQKQFLSEHIRCKLFHK